ncbi:MAG: DUF4276 family protein [Candidatus Caenarcaniphilales bacterium]|nr:DUF4276 family protein [Candidatus Caenarcaniphilales bacterium]
MTTVHISVEGQTEKLFVDKVLNPNFQSLGLYLVPTMLTTSLSPEGRQYKGGFPKFSEVKKTLQNLLDNPNTYVSTMYDFYALPNDFPGLDKVSGIDAPYIKIQTLEQSLVESLNLDNSKQSRFIPYFQLHEFETFIFVDEFKTLGRIYDADAAQKHSFCNILQQYSNPELINTTKGPSKHLKEIFGDRFQKNTDGIFISQDCGIDSLRANCANFNKWIAKLEGLNHNTVIAG